MTINPLSKVENDCGDGAVQTCATSSQLDYFSPSGSDSTKDSPTLAGFDRGETGGISLCGVLDSVSQTLPSWKTSPTVTTSTRQVQCFICNDVVNTTRSGSTSDHIAEIDRQCRPARCDETAVQESVSFYSGGQVLSSQSPQQTGAIPTVVVQHRDMCGPMPVVPAARVGTFSATYSLTSDDPRYDG